MNLRRTALLAAIAQALVGIVTIWPKVIGASSDSVSDQGMAPSIARSISAFALVAIFIFYVVIHMNADRLLVARSVKKVALWTAVVIVIQNLRLGVGNLAVIFFRSQNLLLWQSHPFRQMAYVILPLIPTLWVVSTILFLIATRTRPATDSGYSSVDGRTRYRANTVKLASVLAVAGASVELAAAAYQLEHFRVFTTPAAIQIVLDASLLAFFALMWKSEVVSLGDHRKTNQP